jgi:hypothetical protein
MLNENYANDFFSLDFVKSLNHTNEKIIARKDATITADLLISCVKEFLKASMEMKILIVKPMAARRPSPIMCFHFKPFDNSPSFNLTVSQQKKRMPVGLPINKPKMIPRLSVLVRLEEKLSGITMAVLVSTNKGIMRKLT